MLTRKLLVQLFFSPKGLPPQKVEQEITQSHHMDRRVHLNTQVAI